MTPAQKNLRVALAATIVGSLIVLRIFLRAIEWEEYNWKIGASGAGLVICGGFIYLLIRELRRHRASD
ncbi:hypothetical protein [Flaviaesturariibacter amylovorans]|uniref:Uncharacterized protein n=1 Tax=Flaviaesturariibacter amylovorans TaxID=1084520 RepID=A0ABP8HAG6_9BACT